MYRAFRYPFRHFLASPLAVTTSYNRTRHAASEVSMKEVQLYVGDAIGRYGFPNGHPFGPDRQDAFWNEAVKQGLPGRVELCEPREATRVEIERFHRHEHVERVRVLSHEGYGSIDYGDTPAYPGVYDASANVVGAALEGLAAVMTGEC